MRLQFALAVLTLAGVLGGLALDSRSSAWLQGHPVTGNVIAGTLTVPVTLLLAAYLVDYFVDRAEKRRKEPLRVHLLQDVRRHSGLALEFMARAWWGEGQRTLEQNLYAVRRAWDSDARCMYDYRDRVPLPPGWKHWPAHSLVGEAGAQVPTVRGTAARHVAKVLELVDEYAANFDDPACWLFADLLEADAELLKGFGERGPDVDIPPHAAMGVAEYLAALLLHLRLVEPAEWPEGAGPAPRSSVEPLDRMTLAPSFRTVIG